MDLQKVMDETEKRQARFDGAVADWLNDYRRRGGLIYCGKGCRHCCNLAVNATYPEAVLVARAVGEGQLDKLRRHAARLAEIAAGAPDLVSYLRAHRANAGFCPFLGEDGACSVYAARPFSCRSLLATKESSWCGQDFAVLGAAERRVFMDGLDRSVVAFPMHYVAVTQELGQQYELESSRIMEDAVGFTLYGSLAYLVYLEKEHGLGEVVARGYVATLEMLRHKGLLSRFLVIMESGSEVD